MKTYTCDISIHITNEFCEKIQDAIDDFEVDEIACPYLVGIHVYGIDPDMPTSEVVECMNQTKQWRVIQTGIRKTDKTTNTDRCSMILKFVSDPWKKGGLLYYLMFQKVRARNMDKHYILMSNIRCYGDGDGDDGNDRDDVSDKNIVNGEWKIMRHCCVRR